MEASGSVFNESGALVQLPEQEATAIRGYPTALKIGYG